MQKAKVSFYLALTIVFWLIAEALAGLWYGHFPTLLSPSIFPEMASHMPENYIVAINFWSSISNMFYNTGGFAIMLFGWFAMLIVTERVIWGKMILWHHRYFYLASITTTIVFGAIAEGDLGGYVIMVLMLFHAVCVAKGNWEEDSSTTPALA